MYEDMRWVFLNYTVSYHKSQYERFVYVLYLFFIFMILFLKNENFDKNLGTSRAVPVWEKKRCALDFGSLWYRYWSLFLGIWVNGRRQNLVPVHKSVENVGTTDFECK